LVIFFFIVCSFWELQRLYLLPQVCSFSLVHQILLGAEKGEQPQSTTTPHTPARGLGKKKQAGLYSILPTIVRYCMELQRTRSLRRFACL